jgi:hypothetical protein
MPMVDQGSEPAAPHVPRADTDDLLDESGADRVTAIHLDDHRFEIPSRLASEIFDQLDSSIDTTRAVLVTLSDEACIMIAPDDPMVIFVQRDEVETGA